MWSREAYSEVGSTLEGLLPFVVHSHRLEHYDWLSMNIAMTPPFTLGNFFKRKTLKSGKNLWLSVSNYL